MFEIVFAVAALTIVTLIGAFFVELEIREDY